MQSLKFLKLSLLLSCALCALTGTLHAQEVGEKIPADQQQAAQPSVTVEINNTSTEIDDLVRHGLTTPCRAKVTGNPENDVTVVLTTTANVNAGSVSFSAPGVQNPNPAILTLTLPKEGGWKAFTIGGAQKSQTASDVTVDTHLNSATGNILDSKAVSVFWFSDALITATTNIPTSNYVLHTVGNNDIYEPQNGGVGIRLIAQIRLNPSGLDANATQIARLRFGIRQDADIVNNFHRTIFSPPVVDSYLQWQPGSIAGQVYLIPSYIRTATIPPRLAEDGIASEPVQAYNDTDDDVPYHYYSRLVPLLTSELTTKLSNDTPSTVFSPIQGYTSRLYQIQQADGIYLDILIPRYYRISAEEITKDFHTWAVLTEVQGTTEITSQREYVAETTWHLNVNSVREDQHATGGVGGTVITPRAPDTPSANEVLNLNSSIRRDWGSTFFPFQKPLQPPAIIAVP